jgi:hypothetical protein
MLGSVVGGGVVVAGGPGGAGFPQAASRIRTKTLRRSMLRCSLLLGVLECRGFDAAPT